MSNPFADVDSFETLRAAAMGDDEAFERYRRRESAPAGTCHASSSCSSRPASRG